MEQYFDFNFNCMVFSEFTDAFALEQTFAMHGAEFTINLPILDMVKFFTKFFTFQFFIIFEMLFISRFSSFSVPRFSVPCWHSQFSWVAMTQPWISYARGAQCRRRWLRVIDAASVGGSGTSACRYLGVSVFTVLLL